MSNNDLAIVILAAGKGTRLKSSLAKVLHRAGGRTLVEQIVRACEPLKARKTETAVSAIVEDSQLTEEQRDINEINSAIYCFTLEKLWPALAEVKPHNKHREVYLTDAIAAMSGKGETVLAEVAADSREVLGCNTRADLAEVDCIFRERKRNALMDDGVTIQLPETVLIDPDVTAGEDTIIEPGVQLLGKTKIGAHCTVRTGSVLTDAILGDHVTVEPHCVVAESRLDDGVIIGPFARLRPNNHLKAGARIGNFVELKKSTIGEGTKAMHLSYLGDAKIGTKSNIGAGTITCNYDGFHKHPTSIGNKVFIGSDATLVAPVRVGDGAYIAAGSTITENVPSHGLGIARGRQINKPGWAAKKRRELAAAENPKKAAKKSKRRKATKKRK